MRTKTSEVLSYQPNRRAITGWQRREVCPAHQIDSETRPRSVGIGVTRSIDSVLMG